MKNTLIGVDSVSFEDLILDILVFPDGEYYILDEDELPVSIECFEEGKVKSALNMLTSTLLLILENAKEEAASTFSHESLSSYLC